MNCKFLNSTDNYNNSSIVLCGYPFDASSSFRRGSSEGPNSIRHYSQSIETYSPYFDIDIVNKKYYDMGDVELSIANNDLVMNEIYANVKRILNDKKIHIGIGGEHTITYPIIKAYKEFYNDFHLIVFDAHADLKSIYEGNKLSHACTMYLCSNIIGFKNISILGVRSYEKREIELLEKLNLFSREYNDNIDFNSIENVYISIDLDFLDSSIMPGTGNPEPLGWSMENFIKTLKKLKNKNIIGADVVELSPIYDVSGISSINASIILRELISIIKCK